MQINLDGICLLGQLTRLEMRTITNDHKTALQQWSQTSDKILIGLDPENMKVYCDTKQSTSKI